MLEFFIILGSLNERVMLFEYRTVFWTTVQKKFVPSCLGKCLIRGKKKSGFKGHCYLNHWRGEEQHWRFDYGLPVKHLATANVSALWEKC